VYIKNNKLPVPGGKKYLVAFTPNLMEEGIGEKYGKSKKNN